METTTKGKEIESLGLKYIETIDGDINEFDAYLTANLDFEVSIIKQKFETYTMYSVSYEISPGDWRISSTTLMKKTK